MVPGSPDGCRRQVGGTSRSDALDADVVGAEEIFAAGVLEPGLEFGGADGEEGGEGDGFRFGLGLSGVVKVTDAEAGAVDGEGDALGAGAVGDFHRWGAGGEGQARIGGPAADFEGVLAGFGDIEVPVAVFEFTP